MSAFGLTPSPLGADILYEWSLGGAAVARGHRVEGGLSSERLLRMRTVRGGREGGLLAQLALLHGAQVRRLRRHLGRRLRMVAK